MAKGEIVGQAFSEINVTPLTDVFLVLVVLMLLIGSNGDSHVIKTWLGPFDKCGERGQHPATIDAQITSTGQVKINGKAVANSDMVHLMAAIEEEQTKIGKKEVPFRLASDANAAHGCVVAVMDAAAGAGIRELDVLPLSN